MLTQTYAKEQGLLVFRKSLLERTTCTTCTTCTGWSYERTTCTTCTGWSLMVSIEAELEILMIIF